MDTERPVTSAKPPRDVQGHILLGERQRLRHLRRPPRCPFLSRRVPVRAFALGANLGESPVRRRMVAGDPRVSTALAAVSLQFYDRHSPRVYLFRYPGKVTRTALLAVVYY